MTPPRPQQRDRCRVCGRVLPAWMVAAQRPNGAMLLHHLADMHPAEARPYLQRMATEDITTVAAKAYEVTNHVRADTGGEFTKPLFFRRGQARKFRGSQRY